MKINIEPAMKRARDLVLASRLDEATAAIRDALGGGRSQRDGSTPPETGSDFRGPTLDLRAIGGRAAAASTTPAMRTKPRFPLPSFRGGQMRPGPVPSIPEGARFLRLRHDGPFGGRAYRLYVPAAGADGPRPLLVMLHGCTQDPETFAVGTRMNALAEEAGILVAYPEQERSANPSLCWNWFDPGHQGHGVGEPAIIAGIVADIAGAHSVDRKRVFVAGLSAGGAMAAVLGEAYPDVFAAVGVHSGLPRGAASDVASALSVMRSGRAVARGTPSRRAGRLIVFHGERDTTVHPTNGEHVAGLAKGGAEPRAEASSTGGRTYTRRVEPAAGGRGAVEYWRVEGLGHAWSGGDPAGSYADPAGPDASREMLRFFLDPRG